LTDAVVRIVVPTGNPPLVVVAVRVGVRVLVAEAGPAVRVGVAVELGPETSAR
jgi:hypothetical protein